MNCPHCQGLVRVPDFAGPPAPPSTTAMELNCPVCAGPFQVLAEFAGQQVHCPHCQRLVTVPGWGGWDAGEIAPPPVPCSTHLPSPAVPPSAPIPPPTVRSHNADLYPPGYQAGQPSVSSAGATPQGLYPPAKPQHWDREREPTHDRPVPPQSERKSPTTRSPASHSLLPPGTGSTAGRPPVPADLLPPGIGDAAVTVERKPLPASVPAKPKEVVLIPTEKGYVGVHEPVQTVRHHGEEVELRKLTPGEKARRRLVRNTVLFALCIITLIVIAAMFTRK